MKYQKCEKCQHYHEELEECNVTANPAWEVPENECKFLAVEDYSNEMPRGDG